MQLIWSVPATMQLENIYHYYSQRNIEAATRIYNNIIDEAEMLTQFPEMAAIEPILADYTRIYRSLIVKKHFKVVYRIEEENIYVVAVFDCRQDPQKLISLTFE
jgi:plasmid stabilization system protein ParE